MSNESKEELIERAKELGLEPHPNTGELKLTEMIKEAEGEPAKSKEPAKSVVESKIQRHARLRKEQKELVRVIVHCNDDAKKEWNSVNIKVSNALHSFTRNVPFGNDKGWHIEKCIYNMLKEKMCTKFRETKLPNGMKHREQYLTKAYTIEVLKPLTKKELKELAKEQSARGTIE